MKPTLYFLPAPLKKGTPLSHGLKHILAKRYLLKEGNRFLDKDVIPYLQGLSDGGMKEADKLIAAIEEHSKVELYLEG